MLLVRACLAGPAVVVIAVAAAACTERGLSEEPRGRCPSDEVCSQKTPLGIELLSRPLFYEGPASPPLRPIARGGTQLLSVSYGVPGRGMQPMDHPYIVDAGAAIAVETVFSASLAVRSVEEGPALVRLVDERDGTLYGREVVESLELDRIELVAMDIPHAVPLGAFVFAVGPQWLGVRLFSAARPGSPPVRLVDESVRLVDESMRLDESMRPELAGVQQGAWDVLGVRVTAPGLQTLALHAGGGVRMVELPFVAQADAIVRSRELEEYLSWVGHPSVHCFYATSGAHVIVGTAWSFAADNGPVRDGGPPGCVEVQPEARGMLRLTVRALGISRELAIRVI